MDKTLKKIIFGLILLSLCLFLAGLVVFKAFFPDSLLLVLSGSYPDFLNS